MTTTIGIIQLFTALLQIANVVAVIWLTNKHLDTRDEVERLREEIEGKKH